MFAEPMVYRLLQVQAPKDLMHIWSCMLGYFSWSFTAVLQVLIAIAGALYVLAPFLF